MSPRRLSAPLLLALAALLLAAAAASAQEDHTRIKTVFPGTDTALVLVCYPARANMLEAWLEGGGSIIGTKHVFHGPGTSIQDFTAASTAHRAEGRIGVRFDGPHHGLVGSEGLKLYKGASPVPVWVEEDGQIVDFDCR